MKLSRIPALARVEPSGGVIVPVSRRHYRSERAMLDAGCYECTSKLATDPDQPWIGDHMPPWNLDQRVRSHFGLSRHDDTWLVSSCKRAVVNDERGRHVQAAGIAHGCHIDALHRVPQLRYIADHNRPAQVNVSRSPMSRKEKERARSNNVTIDFGGL